MKLILIQHKDHFEVNVMDGSLRIHAYVFDTKNQVEAFCSGFHCAKTVANALVQSMPMGYETKTIAWKDVPA